MNIEDFLLEADCRLSAKWEKDREDYDWTEKDSHIAAVLTRIDTGLNLVASSYRSKQLRSINIGVWGIFIVLLLDFLTQ